MKNELSGWQKDLVKNRNILALPIQCGQVGSYRESIYEYEIIDIYGQYTNDQLLKICITEVHHSSLPIDPRLDLLEHVLSFKKIGSFTYNYKSGHDYTD